MLGRLYERENCSAARALELVGERWSLLIIRNAAFAGARRFSDFERRLGIAPNVLTNRLDGFVAAGIMDQVPVEHGAGHEYVLTDKGSELGEVVMALTAWGDRWAAPNGPPIVMQHDGCGGHVHFHLECDRCGARPPVTDVVASAGPGASDEVKAARPPLP